MLFFFFFKQKTAYEMRISDWSSDVCSSDLQAQAAGFSLDEIAELIALDAGRDRARARELARDKIGALDAKIAELTGARTALQRLARECAASDDGPCPIIAAFDCP